MGVIQDFFSSPREREAPKRFEDILKEVGGLQSAYGDLSDVAGVRGKFGLKGAQRAFDPARKNLSTRRGQALSSASSRMSGRVATPEGVFAPIEGEFAGAFGDLESQASMADLDDERFVASLLDSILGKKDQFGMNKLNLKRGATGDYLGSLSNASTFDDILAAANTAAKFIPKPV